MPPKSNNNHASESNGQETQAPRSSMTMSLPTSPVERKRHAAVAPNLAINARDLKFPVSTMVGAWSQAFAQRWPFAYEIPFFLPFSLNFRAKLIDRVSFLSERPTAGKADHSPTGIHFETGLWMNVPPTNNTPVLGESLVRMGSIPHGTTINAQCLAPTSNFSGPPEIPPASLAVLPVGGGPVVPIDSLNASITSTLRRPQDLSKFIAAGTITQDILDDPNTILRNAIEGQTILQNIAFTVSTAPAAPVFGGGTANIAFLEGNAAATTPNADAIQMNATFWIETVQHTLEVPIFKPGQAPMKISPASPADQPVPVFLVSPPYEITAPTRITETSIQIQYSQIILLVFNQLVWPHISVSTLIPSEPVTVPDSVWG